jgi:AsmA protein
MTRSTKISLLVLAILAGLAIILVILVKTLVTPEKIRDRLIPLAEQRLERKVTLGEVEIGLFSGVSLKDLVVKQKAGTEDFINMKSLNMHFQLLPLLTGKVVIDQIRLEQPKIIISRNPDGGFNFSDLLGQKGAGSGDGNASAPTDATSTSAMGSLDLLVNEVDISGGELYFIDRYQSSQTPYRYTLTQLSLQARQITLDKSFPIELKAMLNGTNITLSGAYDLKKQSGNISLGLEPLELIQFAPYYRAFLPGKLGTGRLSLTIEADIAPGRVSSKGQVLLDQFDLVLNGLPDAEFKQAKLKIDYALIYQPEKRQLDISTLFINFNDLVAGAEGSLVLADKEPALDISLKLEEFDLRNLAKGLPAGLVKDLQSYGLAGQVKGQVDLVGKPSAGVQLLKKADLQLIDVQASVANLRAGVSGSVNYAEQQLAGKNLQLDFAGQQAQLSFTAANLFARQHTGNFQLSAETLDLNKLLPASKSEANSPGTVSASGDSNATSAQQQLESSAEEIGPFDLPVTLQGTLDVNKLVYKQLTLDQVKAELLLKDNHLQITRFNSGIAGGKLSAAADLNLGVKGLSYQGQVNLSQSQLATLIAGLYPTAGKSLSGLLQSQNNFSGRGTIPDKLLKTLQVKGQLLLQQGQVTGFPLLEQFAGFLGNPELKEPSFDTLQSQYELRDGTTKLSGNLSSSTIRLIPVGTVGLDGQLNLKLGVHLAPEVASKLKIKGISELMVSDENGWGVLPLKIKGSLADPRFDYDAELLQKQAVDKVEKRLEKQLLKKIAPKGKDEAPAKQMLDGTLKKLFGK